MTLATKDADLLVGPTRIAKNVSDSSIHDPAEAQKLGFRGAAVGGNVHLDLFAPLLTLKQKLPSMPAEQSRRARKPASAVERILAAIVK